MFPLIHSIPNKTSKWLLSTLFLLPILNLSLIQGCTSDQKKMETYISEADAYYEKGNYNKALIQLKNAVKLNPESIQAQSLLAKTYLNLKDLPSAYKTYLRLEQLEPDNLDTKIQLAGFNLLSKNYSDAQKQVAFILEKDPTHIKALYLKAGILVAKKETPDTVKPIYKTIIDLDPNQAKAHIALSSICLSQKQNEEAEAHLLAARKLKPQNLSICNTLYRLYISTNNPDKAQGLLKQLAADFPENTDALSMLATHYLSKKEADKAVAVLEQAMAADPGNIKPHLILARYFNTAGLPQKAEDYIQKAVAIDPDNHELKLLHAEFQFRHNNMEKAEALVDALLQDRPGHAPSKMLKGKILTRKNQLPEAIKIFRELVKEEPDSEPYNFWLGSALFQNNRSKEGLPFISKTLELNPNQMQARMIMAESHFKNKDFFIAETEIQHILSKNPDDYDANLLLGNIHSARNELEQAKTIYKRLIEISPENPAAWFRLGLVNKQEKKTKAALDNFYKALSLKPTLMDVFTQIISIHAEQKKHKRALKLCNTHLEKVKDSPIAESIILNLKAGTLMALKKRNLAKDALSMSIEKNPAYITPYLNLAGLHKSQGDRTKAMELYKTLIKIRPDQASPHSLLGSLYEKEKKWDQAQAHYKKALDIDPDYIPALNNLAFLYAEQNKNLDEALEFARRAREKTGEITAIIDTLGWVYYKKELFPSAVQEFKTCVEKEPENPIFHYHLGLAYNKMWKYDQAKEALEKALSIQNDFIGSADARKILGKL